MGGVPAEHKTDSLRTACKQQGEDGLRELTERYVKGVRNMAEGNDDISVVAWGMEQMLNAPGELDLHRLMRFLRIKEK